jgi:hypothetical protein
MQDKLCPPSRFLVDGEEVFPHLRGSLTCGQAAVSWNAFWLALDDAVMALLAQD